MFQRIPAVLLAIGLGAMPLNAQSSDGGELSSDQINDLFQQQTRGLVLAPQGGATETTAETTEPVAEVAAETYTELAPEMQINIQISFDFDSAALRADQKDRLSNMCAAMQASDIGKFKVIGHTDSSGAAAYNASLSQLRAEEVKRFLVSECGIAETRLEAIGVGEEFPINKQNTRADENRRVEFQVGT